MENVTLCVCGCGEPAVYAARHCNMKPRATLTEGDYIIENRGYKTPCWVFKNRKGRRKEGKYNHVRLGSRQIFAHRAMYEQEVGPIPLGYFIDHLCRETRCIRPDHLEAVTPAVNSQRSKTAKLSMDKAREIRAAQGRESAKGLGVRFGVSEFLIYQVWRGQIWKEV